MKTDYHAKYFSYDLTKKCAADTIEKFVSTLSDAQVQLNPHQIDAALFAFKSPFSKGAILADEVGLGKTIEAGIVISQYWAERKKKILIIMPSSLRKQWQQELEDKFFLKSVILEAKTFNNEIKNGNLNPFEQDSIVICSYNFARNKAPYIKALGEKFHEVNKFSDFEREFPNICFSLATGVGKTRLMGAFIAYLHLEKGINNFFVLAPNLTIYNKLKEDFGNPSSPKYVFKGLSRFAVSQPQVITGETYNKHQNLVENLKNTLFKRVRINVFNISKINSDVDKKTGLARIGLFDNSTIEQYEKEISEIVDDVKEKIEKNIIEIPKILIVPAETKTWFEDFDLDTRFLNIQPLSDEIIRKTLREQASDTIYGAGTYVNDKLDNIIVNELINIPEVDYNSCAKLLFKLANQAIDKFKTYQSEDKVKNIVQYQKKEIAAFIKPQLMQHFKKEVTKFEAPDVRAFSQILEHNSYKFIDDKIYDFRETIEPASRIKTILFTGFKKAYHDKYKFDSKTEKDFAIILEDDNSVIKWLRPAPNQFNITYDNNKRNYEPDFVVEISDTIYLVETKKEQDIPTEEVQEKARAASKYCNKATEYTTNNGGKPWKYILLPHDSVKFNMTFDYLVNTYKYEN